MSYRGSIVVREGGTTRYFSTRAYDSLSYLFLSEQELKKAAESGCIELRGLDFAWSETGVLMDADGKQLLYFGGESTWETGFRKVLNAFLGHALWPGWTVRFCPRHLVDFGKALGMSRMTLLRGLDDKPDLYDLK